MNTDTKTSYRLDSPEKRVQFCGTNIFEQHVTNSTPTVAEYTDRRPFHDRTLLRGNSTTAKKQMVQLVDKLDELGVRCIPVINTPLEITRTLSVTIRPATDQLLEHPREVLGFPDSDQRTEAQYIMLDCMLILAVNAPLSILADTKLFIIPFLEPEAILYFLGQPKFEKILGLKERVRKSSLTLTFLKELSASSTATITLNLEFCNYWDVFVPTIEPIDWIPMSNQIDYLYRLTMNLYSSKHLYNAIWKYFVRDANLYSLDGKEIWGAHAECLPESWYDKDALIDQILSILSHWLVDGRTEERLAILSDGIGVISAKLDWLCKYLLVPICYGVCWSGRFDREGWTPVFNDSTELKRLIKHLCAYRTEVVSHTEILGTNIKVYVCAPDALHAILLMEDPDAIVLYKKDKLKSLMRPKSTLKDFKIWLAENLNSLTLSKCSVTMWDTATYFERLVQFNEGSKDFESLRSSAIKVKLANLLTEGKARSEQFLESL